MINLNIQLFGGRGRKRGLGVGGKVFAETQLYSNKTIEINCNRFSTISEWESDIRDLDYEVLIVFKNGKPIKAYRGVESEVKPPKKEYTRWNNCIITHNHPKNGTFSIDDIRMLAYYNYKEIRAVISDGVFVFRRKIEDADYNGLTEDIKSNSRMFILKMNTKLNKMQSDFEDGLYDMTVEEFNKHLLKKQLYICKKFYKSLENKNGFEYKRLYLKK